MRAIDLTGKEFGRLTVLRHADARISKRITWVCVCACGCQTLATTSDLKRGGKRSCGCLAQESRRANGQRVRHGMHGTPTYGSWSSMRTRCLNPNVPEFPRYGGRGITICPSWDLFESFFADMGERPDGMTLDRIDNAGNYEPGNCRWTNVGTQNRNARSNVRLTIDGVSRTQSEWSRVSGTGDTTICYRLKHGWSHSEAVFGR